MVYDYITVNLNNREVIPKLQAVQNDTGRGVVIDTGLKNTDNDEAYAYVKKVDGHKVFNDAAIDSRGVVTVNYSQQMLAAAGTAELQIEIVRNLKRVSTFTIELEIAPSIIDEGAIPSTDEYGALEVLIDEANTATAAANNAAGAANTATSAANTATTNANNATSAANTATTNANNATSAADTATTNANNAASAANDAASAADAAASRAQYQASRAEAAVSSLTPMKSQNFEGLDSEFNPSGGASPLWQDCMAIKTGNVVQVNFCNLVTKTAHGQWDAYPSLKNALNQVPSEWRVNVPRSITAAASPVIPTPAFVKFDSTGVCTEFWIPQSGGVGANTEISIILHWITG